MRVQDMTRWKAVRTSSRSASPISVPRLIRLVTGCRRMASASVRTGVWAATSADSHSMLQYVAASHGGGSVGRPSTRRSRSTCSPLGSSVASCSSISGSSAQVRCACSPVRDSSVTTWTRCRRRSGSPRSATWYAQPCVAMPTACQSAGAVWPSSASVGCRPSSGATPRSNPSTSGVATCRRQGSMSPAASASVRWSASRCSDASVARWSPRGAGMAEPPDREWLPSERTRCGCWAASGAWRRRRCGTARPVVAGSQHARRGLTASPRRVAGWPSASDVAPADA